MTEEKQKILKSLGFSAEVDQKKIIARVLLKLKEQQTNPPMPLLRQLHIKRYRPKRSET
jgi:hypothetical protein